MVMPIRSTCCSWTGQKAKVNVHLQQSCDVLFVFLKLGANVVRTESQKKKTKTKKNSATYIWGGAGKLLRDHEGHAVHGCRGSGTWKTLTVNQMQHEHWVYKVVHFFSLTKTTKNRWSRKMTWATIRLTVWDFIDWNCWGSVSDLRWRTGWSFGARSLAWWCSSLWSWPAGSLKCALLWGNTQYTSGIGQHGNN